MKLPPPLEKHIQAQLVKYLTLTGWNVWQMQLGSVGKGAVFCTPGIPDMYVFKPGHACWIEVKRPRLGKVSPAQVERHGELACCGLPVHVVTSLEELQAALAVQP